MLLGALALAAIAGVTAVFIDARWVTLRVMWTGMLTAFATGLTLPLAKMLDRKRTRPAGLFGLSWLVVEYLLVIAMIWLERLLPGRVEEKLIATSGSVLLTGVAAFVALIMLRTPSARWAGRVLLAVTIATLACYMVATWSPGRFWENDEWWGTGWALGGVGVMVAATLLGVETRRRPWRWIGLALGVVGLALTLLEIWDRRVLPDDEFLCPPLSAALVFAFANVIFLVPLRAGQKWLAWAVLLAMIGTMGAINILVLGDGELEEFGRAAIAGAIVTGCGTMAIALLAIFNRRADVEVSSSEVMLITLFCPRCKRKQTSPVGCSECAGCGLRFDLRFEEPRCADCGYLLWGATTGRCPECGRAIETSASSAP